MPTSFDKSFGQQEVNKHLVHFSFWDTSGTTATTKTFAKKGTLKLGVVSLLSSTSFSVFWPFHIIPQDLGHVYVLLFPSYFGLETQRGVVVSAWQLLLSKPLSQLCYAYILSLKLKKYKSAKKPRKQFSTTPLVSKDVSVP